ncbi:MAG: cupin domain-containing protein [Actinobacteria bacterium]|nr:cupin domain-containing protein [Actinomycetota bacterium]
MPPRRKAGSSSTSGTRSGCGTTLSGPPASSKATTSASRTSATRSACSTPAGRAGSTTASRIRRTYLVLAGECLLLVEGEERRLRAWDFVHCPAGTEHIFVGAGAGQCLIYMAGARTAEREIVYPRSELALRHGAGVETETSSPRRRTRRSRNGNQVVPRTRPDCRGPSERTRGHETPLSPEEAFSRRGDARGGRRVCQ